MKKNHFFDSKIITDIKDFKKRSDIIIANRIDSNLDDVIKKTYSRDIFNKD